MLASGAPVRFCPKSGRQTEHVVHQREVEVPQGPLVEDEVLVVLEAEVAAADQRDRQLVPLVIPAVHAGAQEDDAVVEHADAGRLLDGVELAAEVCHLADVPPGDGGEDVAAVVLGDMVLGARAPFSFELAAVKARSCTLSYVNSERSSSSM